MARSRAKARLNFSAQGQRSGRCRVNRRAERVSRPAREKWLRKSEQGDKWNRCLIEGMIVLSETGARDEQTTPP